MDKDIELQLGLNDLRYVNSEEFPRDIVALRERLEEMKKQLDEKMAVLRFMERTLERVKKMGN